MTSLQGKRVLFFAPKFFGYETEICKEMESQGGTVKFYDERNNPTSIEKIFLRKFHFLMEVKITNYYRGICDKEKLFKPDYVFFISPETVNKKSILRMRKIFPSAKFILYMWDSIENKNAKKVYQQFDSCLSFDSDDCKTYGFKFKPLFFVKAFEKAASANSENYKYDFSFIGSVHSDRAKILNRLRKCFDANNLNYFYYLYVPSKLMLWVRSLFDMDFRELKKDYAHLEAISKNKISEVLADSNYVIDINHPKQIGLTMRTLEMLGSHRKLLTTNTYIRDYDFYNPKNQIVVDRNSITIDATKLIKGYSPVADDVYNKYKISTWLKEIFN